MSIAGWSGLNGVKASQIYIAHKNLRSTRGGIAKINAATGIVSAVSKLPGFLSYTYRAARQCFQILVGEKSSDQALLHAIR